jgi:hypothetical protein
MMSLEKPFVGSNGTAFAMAIYIRSYSAGNSFVLFMRKRVAVPHLRPGKLALSIKGFVNRAVTRIKDTVC